MDADAQEAIEQQEEEIETLRAIYDEELSVGGSPGARELTIDIVPASTGRSSGLLQLWVALPRDYPLDADHQPPYGLTGSLAAALDDEHIEASLSELWTDADGAGVIWPWVEWLREFTEPFLLAQPEPVPEPEPEQELEPADDVASQQFESDWATALDAVDAAEQSSSELTMDIVHGEPFIDRKSVFQAHCAKVTSVDEVAQMCAQLRQNRKVASASHNIMAYRIQSERVGTAVVDQDFDDDGETAAGGRLLNMME